MIVHTSIANTSDAASWEQALVDAVDFLTAGQVVALPSETVYGLAADALDRKAVARIFEAKGRPSTNPLIVRICRRGDVGNLCGQLVFDCHSGEALLARSFDLGSAQKTDHSR